MCGGGDPSVDEESADDGFLRVEWGNGVWPAFCADGGEVSFCHAEQGVSGDPIACSGDTERRTF